MSRQITSVDCGIKVCFVKDRHLHQADILCGNYCSSKRSLINSGVTDLLKQKWLMNLFRVVNLDAAASAKIWRIIRNAKGWSNQSRWFVF